MYRLNNTFDTFLALPGDIFRFRKNYGPNEEIEANKAELKDKYAKAKQLGREVTVSHILPGKTGRGGKSRLCHTASQGLECGHVTRFRSGVVLDI